MSAALSQVFREGAQGCDRLLDQTAIDADDHALRIKSRDRRFKEKNPDSKDAKTIKAFQLRDPASFSSFFTIVRLL